MLEQRTAWSLGWESSGPLVSEGTYQLGAQGNSEAKVRIQEIKMIPLIVRSHEYAWVAGLTFHGPYAYSMAHNYVLQRFGLKYYTLTV